MDTQLLVWARALQSIAQTGLHYTEGAYDRERYQQIVTLAAEMIAAQGDLPVDVVRDLLAADKGPGTPRLDVRGAVFKDDALLMVRERMDGDRWTLPGGWADVNESPAETTVREVREESGYETRAVKLLALYDKARQTHPPGIIYVYKSFFRCEITGGAPATSLETSEVRFFREDELPGRDELSLGRVTPEQLARLFEHYRNPDLPTDFD